MNILLADDEGLVRAGLKSMLEELSMPLQVIGETRNGEETVLFVEEHRPDLVLVDIRMPKLNGLEAIAQGKILSPHTKWIILSGYSEFQYAQEALRLGACNYLLKPVSIDELKDCLSRICEQHKHHVMERYQQLEHMLVSLLNSKGSIHEAARNLPTLHAGGFIYFFDNSHQDEEANEWKHQIVRRLQDLLPSPLLTSELYIFAIPLDNGSSVILWAAPPSLASKTALLQQKLELVMQQWMGLNQNESYMITILELEDCSDLEAMARQIQHVQTNSPLRILCPIGTRYSV